MLNVASLINMFRAGFSFRKQSATIRFRRISHIINSAENYFFFIKKVWKNQKTLKPVRRVGFHRFGLEHSNSFAFPFFKFWFF